MNSGSISLVIPVFNVAPYLPDFLDSLDAQRHRPDDVEVVFVDDGSTDDSRSIIERWTRGRGDPIRLVTQPNGGLSAARNSGLAAATRSWVSFPDPDDLLAPGYLKAVAGFLRSPPADEVDLAAARILILDPVTSETKDAHALRYRFSGGANVVDLSREPHHIHMSAATGFYRLERIREHCLTFDTRIRPNFEDGVFTARYLATRDRPRVAHLGNADYLYRRHPASLVQSSWSDPSKYTAIPRFGYLELLRELASGGTPPRWAQNIVLYDLFSYLREDASPAARTRWLTDELRDQFFSIVGEVLQLIDPEAIVGYRITWTSSDMRAALLALRGEPSQPAELVARDDDQRLVQVRYKYTGRAPHEAFEIDGSRAIPQHAKSRPIAFLGRTLLNERIAWLAADDRITLRLDGQPTQIVAPAPAPVPISPPRSPVQRRWASRLRRLTTRTGRSEARRRVADALAERSSHLPWFGRRYTDGWVFADHATPTGGSAERLAGIARSTGVNAWLVADSTSPDRRSRARTVVPYVPIGSLRHRVLLRRATTLVTSVAASDLASAFGPADHRRSGSQGRLVLLIPENLPATHRRALDRFAPDLVLTSSASLYDELTSDGTSGALTSKDTQLVTSDEQAVTAIRRLG